MNTNECCEREQLNHDLRTGLNAILGFAELLDRKQSGVDRENVQHILKAGRELLAIVDLRLGDEKVESTPSARTVLCVEDNNTNFALIEQVLLMRPEIQLQRAMTGEGGLGLALKNKPELILLDLNLPDIHGAEVMQRLREKPETANIPVVVVSADATSSQIERLLKAGARNYLTKPIQIDEMLAVVDEALGLTAPA